MNIIKGIDRIALLIAIVVMVPVFLHTIVDLKKPIGVSPKYIKWKKEYDDRIEYLRQINPSTGKFQTFLDILKREDDDKILQDILSRRPYKHAYRTGWVPYIWGVIASFISFIAVLFGICGATRGIKWFSLWIIAGFKDEKKSQNNP